jgi:hypothetical protein
MEIRSESGIVHEANIRRKLLLLQRVRTWYCSINIRDRFLVYNMNLTKFLLIQESPCILRYLSCEPPSKHIDLQARFNILLLDW